MRSGSVAPGDHTLVRPRIGPGQNVTGWPSQHNQYVHSETKHNAATDGNTCTSMRCRATMRARACLSAARGLLQENAVSYYKSSGMTAIHAADTAITGLAGARNRVPARDTRRSSCHGLGRRGPVRGWWGRGLNEQEAKPVENFPTQITPYLKGSKEIASKPILLEVNLSWIISLPQKSDRNLFVRFYLANQML